MSKHEMTYERSGMRKPKKKAVKTKKKSSAISRKLKSVQRTVRDVLGGIGIIAVLIWMFQVVTGGR